MLVFQIKGINAVRESLLLRLIAVNIDSLKDRHSLDSKRVEMMRVAASW